jgi:myo-inositol-1(or 4)-monophosphatase
MRLGCNETASIGRITWVFEHERDLAQELLRSGGAVLMELHGQHLAIKTKQSRSDVVTEAAIASEAAMLAFLAAEAPNDGALSEEGRLYSGPCWS